MYESSCRPRRKGETCLTDERGARESSCRLRNINHQSRINLEREHEFLRPVCGKRYVSQTPVGSEEQYEPAYADIDQSQNPTI